MRLNRTAVAVVTLLVAGVAAAAIGPYARARMGVRQSVCAQDLYVRVAPNDGAWTGTLKYGETFTPESRNGDYVYGFAYGQLNRKGWVQDGWFCN
ncbi:hypothetical protein KYC5002_28135 [Archangium violaceum]|uniref:hypothetical protein n=1 Tax=Archangium violaceum TaxID=83451 RepID=UPI002B2E34F4|nr:hypothetical protein F0U59_22955 [Archangium gephyra]WPB72920.1 hypothetical protein KYC5002_28135 [Archangium gephyra]